MTDRELQILTELAKTYSKSGTLYKDLSRALPDEHPHDLKQVLQRLQDQKLCHFLEYESGGHLFARITSLGHEELYKSGKVSAMTFHFDNIRNWAGIAAVTLLLIVMLSGILPIQSLLGDLTGVGLTDETNEIMTNYIEGQIGDVSDWYTVYLQDQEDNLYLYLVQCREDFELQCTHQILFIEVDVNTNEVTNVELPRASE